MSNFHQPSGGSSNVHQPSFAANTPEPKSSEYLVLTRRDFDTLSDMNLQFFLNNTELHKRNEQLQKRNQELQQEIKNHAELQKRNQQLQEEIMRLRAELTLSQQNPAYGLGRSES
jgi:cell shape-determining protein MreC